MSTMVTGVKGWIGSKLYEKVGGVGIDVRDGLNLLSCELPEKVEIIYHLAAQSSVESSWHDPLHDVINHSMMVRLVHKYPKAKIIYTNSAASLDRKSPYGFSKWVAGEYLKAFHTNYVICILPNVYGPGSRSVVDIFKGQEEVTVYGDGSNVRDYVFVEDIVEGIVKASKWPRGEYQMGSGIPTTVLKLAGAKKVHFAPNRKESKESVLINNTPNWSHTMDVLSYLHDH